MDFQQQCPPATPCALSSLTLCLTSQKSDSVFLDPLELLQVEGSKDSRVRSAVLDGFPWNLDSLKNDLFFGQSQEISFLVALWSNRRDLPIRFVTGSKLLYPATIG